MTSRTARVHLVTGASRGIGAAVASELRRAGDEVIGLARKRPDDWDGGFLEADLSTPAGVASAQEQISEIPVLWGLVNCAGVAKGGALADVELTDFQSTFMVNVFGLALVTQAAIARMLEGGRIVNFCSTSMGGKAERSVYGSSKAAVASLTRTWGRELGPHGILANAVSPGPIDTEMFRRRHPAGSDAEAAVLAGIPTGMIGTADEIARLTAFLLGPGNGYINGQVIEAAGG